MAKKKELYREDLIAMLDALEPNTKLDFLYLSDSGPKWLKLQAVHMNADVDDLRLADRAGLVLVDIGDIYD